MPYATAQDIIDRLPEGSDGLLLLADRDADGVADAVVVAGALKDASDEVDAYIGARYALPLAAVPALLTRLTTDIAIYRMARDAARATEENRTRYEDAVALLKAIARGDATAGIAEATGEQPAQGGTAEFSASPRLFGRGRMP